MEEISFQELKQLYSSRKIGCKKSIGKTFVPGHIDYRELPILKKEIIKKDFLQINGKTLTNVTFEKKVLEDPQYYTEYVPDKIVDKTCKSFICKPCRNNLKNNLHQNILREVYRLRLENHLIITFPGLYDRIIFGYGKSFRMVNNDWNKLVKCIRRQGSIDKEKTWIKDYSEGKIKKTRKLDRKYKAHIEVYSRKRNNKSEYKNNLFHNNEIPTDELAYIYLPRAQTQPKDNNPAGFCHLHVLTNWKLNVHWIDECIDMNGYELGFCFIRENQSVADYLCKDFFEDDEWVIPKRIRHYNSSRNVKINIAEGYSLPEGTRSLMTYKEVEDKNAAADIIEEQLLNNYTNYEIFGKKFKVQDPKILPFEEYIKKFVEIGSIKTKEVYDYGSLTRYNLYNKKHHDFYNKRGINKNGM